MERTPRTRTINIEMCFLGTPGVIRESWEEKGGCPATNSGALPPESEDLEVPVADLKA